jgi:hypothetical protein
MSCLRGGWRDVKGEGGGLGGGVIIRMLIWFSSRGELESQLRRDDMRERENISRVAGHSSKRGA